MSLARRRKKLLTSSCRPMFVTNASSKSQIIALDMCPELVDCPRFKCMTQICRRALDCACCVPSELQSAHERETDINRQCYMIGCMLLVCLYLQQVMDKSLASRLRDRIESS